MDMVGLSRTRETKSRLKPTLPSTQWAEATMAQSLSLWLHPFLENGAWLDHETEIARDRDTVSSEPSNVANKTTQFIATRV